MSTRRPINRNARMDSLSLSMMRSSKKSEDFTWECVKGTPGFYQPQRYNQAPDPEDGLKFVYKGCGVMEPRNIRGFLHRRSCACESEARRFYEEHMQQLAFIRRQTPITYGWLGEGKSDLELAEKSFENYDRSWQPDGYDAVVKYAAITSGTLVLYGTYGTGKTHLLAALCNELIRQQMPCLFVAAPKLFETIQEHISRGEPWVHIVQRAITTQFLVIDDIGKAKLSDHRKEVYFAIIDERTKAGKPIAISMNGDLKDLHKFVGGACASRLSIKRIAPKMAGEDYRPHL